MSWRRLPAPAVPLGQPDTSTGPAAWGIRFATPTHGFVFGSGLWVTTDGGRHWRAAAYPGGVVLSLEISSGQVLAVTARAGPDGPTGWTLSRRALGGPVFGDMLGQLLLTDDGGLTWHAVTS